MRSPYRPGERERIADRRMDPDESRPCELGFVHYSWLLSRGLLTLRILLAILPNSCVRRLRHSLH